MRGSFSLIILVFCTICKLSQAQQQEVDSLKNLLQQTTPIEKARINYLIAGKYEKSMPERALAFYEEGLKLSKEINNDTLIATGFSNIGYININSGKYHEAIDYLFRALKIFEHYQVSKNTIKCLQYIGIAYNQQGMYDKAMNYTIQAMQLAQSSGNDYSTSVCMTMIGSIYYAQFMNDTTLHYLNDKALDYFQRALEIMQKVGDQQGISDALNNVALIYEQKKDFSKSLQYHFQSLKMAQELNDKRGIAASYHNIGLVYKSIGNFSRSVEYLDSCIAIAKEVGEKFYIKECYNTLSEIYSQMGKYDQAYKYHLVFSKYQDTLLNEESKKQFAELNTIYESDKKDNQINLLSKDQEIQVHKMNQQKLIRNFFVLGFIIVLLSSALFFIQRNKISKEKKRSDGLLLNILPGEVAEELKERGSAEAKQFEQVTVMFTDFKNFTQLSEKLTPSELVAEIHTYFKAFDQIISKHNIEKIKTIGDAYMCAGGIPVANRTHATDVVNAALEIKEFMHSLLEQRKNEKKELFEIRIGIHTGPVVAGIVGVKKFVYDIWGDTVNIAKRMESSGEANKVNISGSTFDLVKEKYKCFHRGKVQAKNKGMIDMYFLESMA